MEKEICLLCGCQNPEIRNEEKEYEFNNKKFHVVHEYYLCPECEEEWVTPEQMDKVTDEISHLKRKAHGFLAPIEIKELRERHGLTQEQAAAVFGGGKNAFSKYERGEAYPSRAMDTLMALFDEVPEARQALYEKANIKILNVEEIEIGSMSMTMDSLSKQGKIIPFPSFKTKSCKLEFDLQM